jgi:hypothetical protein
LTQINASRDMWCGIISPPSLRSRVSLDGGTSAANVIVAYTALAKATAETQRVAAVETATRAADAVAVASALAHARSVRQRVAAAAVAAAKATASVAAGAAATATAETQVRCVLLAVLCSVCS